VSSSSISRSRPGCLGWERRSMSDHTPARSLAARALDVRPGEQRRVAALFTASFILGLALTLFDLAVAAHLLAAAAPEDLPWARVAVGAAVLASGAALAALRVRLSPAALAAGPLMLLAAVGLSLVPLLAEPPGLTALLGLYAAQRVLSALALVAFWTVAARALDVAESRRLYALVSAGELLAVVVIGLAAGPLHRALALQGLLALSLVLLAAGAALLLPLARRPRSERAAAPTPEAPASRDERRHAARCVVYHVAYNVTCTLVDFAALLAVQRADPGRPDALAATLGALVAARVAVAAVVRLVAAGRLLERLGPGPALALGPAAVLVVAAAALLSGAAMPAAPSASRPS
jgi:hypothetical protein